MSHAVHMGMKTWLKAAVIGTCWIMSVGVDNGAMAQKVTWAKRILGELTWPEVQAAATSPREVCFYVRHRIRPVEDLGNGWPTGKEAWDRGHGACRSFAACIADLCKAKGMDAEIHLIYPKGEWEGHAVVMGHWKGKVWFSSNGWYQEATSMTEAERAVVKNMGWQRRAVVTARRVEKEKRQASRSAPVIMTGRR